jgi:hypothetical protein
MLNGGAIMWKTKLQPSVATSTAHAEFVAASQASDEVMILRRMLHDLHAPQRTPTVQYVDNRAARLMGESPAPTPRTKHIDIRVFALRERILDGVVRLVDCPTHDMVADLLTKNLPLPSFLKHRNVLFGLQRHTAPVVPSYFCFSSFYAPVSLVSRSTGG